MFFFFFMMKRTAIIVKLRFLYKERLIKEKKVTLNNRDALVPKLA